MSKASRITSTLSRPPTSVKVLPYSCVTDDDLPRLEAQRARHEVRQAHRPPGPGCAAWPAGRRGRGRAAAARPAPRPARRAPGSPPAAAGPCACAAGRGGRRRESATPAGRRARRPPGARERSPPCLAPTALHGPGAQRESPILARAPGAPSALTPAPRVLRWEVGDVRPRFAATQGAMDDAFVSAVALVVALSVARCGERRRGDAARPGPAGHERRGPHRVRGHPHRRVQGRGHRRAGEHRAPAEHDPGPARRAARSRTRASSPA